MYVVNLSLLLLTVFVHIYVRHIQRQILLCSQQVAGSGPEMCCSLCTTVCSQQVSGSGPEGQIRAQDVLSFTPGAAPVVTPLAGPPGAAYMDIPTSSIRQVSHPHIQH